MTEQENHRSIEVHCPACQAKPGDQCNAATDTGRKDVTWFHFARLDRSWWLFGAVRLVKDKHGDIWQHNATTGEWDSYETASFSIEHIEKKWGPVQSLTDDELTAYVQTKELRERREEAQKHLPAQTRLPVEPQMDTMPVSALKKNSEPQRQTIEQVAAAHPERYQQLLREFTEYAADAGQDILKRAMHEGFTPPVWLEVIDVAKKRNTYERAVTQFRGKYMR